MVIGTETVILGKYKIVMEAVMGANAVVTKDVPSNLVWGGMPAREIRDLKSS